MSQPLHRLLISKGESFFDSEAPALELEKWLLVISRDPEFDCIEFVEGMNPKTKERINISCPNSAMWNGHPDNIPVRFTFDSSGIEVEWADAGVEEKAAAVAQYLGALVHREIFD